MPKMNLNWLELGTKEEKERKGKTVTQEDKHQVTCGNLPWIFINCVKIFSKLLLSTYIQWLKKVRTVEVAKKQTPLSA
tara:strand:+ start:63 stop:296 length:234 start_codon:yes stop_codon:yes gene_type:complete